MAENRSNDHTQSGRRQPGSTTGKVGTSGQLKVVRNAKRADASAPSSKSDINANFKDAGVETRKEARRKKRQEKRTPGRHAAGKNAGAKKAPTGRTSAGNTSAGRTSTGHTSAGRTSAGRTSAGRTSAGRTSAGRTSAAATSAKRLSAKHAAGKKAPRKLGLNPLLIGGIAGAVVLLLVVGGAIFACTRSSSGGSQGDQANGTTQTSVEDIQKTAAKMSFCAVGTNIANEDILKSADAWAGAAGDKTYDFSPLYEQVRGPISQYDVAFVSQGTILGGTSFEYQGYPSYNTPDSMADAIAQAGFDVVNCNTNHVYDFWVDAIQHSQSAWAKHPELTTIGSYASAEDRKNIRVVERNGMKVAFLSYCYGQNGYNLSDLPNDYFAAPFNKDAIREEVARAKDLADAVVVYMHWNEMDAVSGSSDTSILSDEQQDYASYLAGLGVDLLIGCRGQRIQPVTYMGRGIRTTDGSGVTSTNGMLCVYGLGDFVSAYTVPEAVLSGMFTCDFVRDANGEVSVQNPTWHPLIEHRSGNVDCVYPLTSYTADLAASNELLARLREGTGVANVDPLQWAREITTQTVGNAIALDM